MYSLTKKPTINIFKRKNTPNRRRADIKKNVKKFDLIVKNFKIGEATTTVKAKIKRVAIRYPDSDGMTIPLLNTVVTKNITKK